jgi:hypothetical protein
MIFDATIHWIPREYGGLLHPPYEGMRPTIRLQKHIEEWLQGAFSATLGSFLNTDNSFECKVIMNYLPDDKKSIFKFGEQFELLDGYRVIGVGIVQSDCG